MSQALRQLASLGAFALNSGFHRVRTMLDGKISDNDRAELAFRSGARIDQKKYLQCPMMGNATRRHSLTYDEDARFDAIAKLSPKKFCKYWPGFGTSPIFIIGMPRSDLISRADYRFSSWRLRRRWIDVHNEFGWRHRFPETVAALPPSEWHKLGELQNNLSPADIINQNHR